MDPESPGWPLGKRKTLQLLGGRACRRKSVRCSGWPGSLGPERLKHMAGEGEANVAVSEHLKGNRWFYLGNFFSASLP